MNDYSKGCQSTFVLGIPILAYTRVHMILIAKELCISQQDPQLPIHPPRVASVPPGVM